MDCPVTHCEKHISGKQKWRQYGAELDPTPFLHRAFIISISIISIVKQFPHLMCDVLISKQASSKKQIFPPKQMVFQVKLQQALGW